jgi:hypothetical protein
LKHVLMLTRLCVASELFDHAFFDRLFVVPIRYRQVYEFLFDVVGGLQVPLRDRLIREHLSHLRIVRRCQAICGCLVFPCPKRYLSRFCFDFVC